MNHEPLPICLDKSTGSNIFDEIIIGRFTRISFHRTLRIPEDGRDYPLPAGLGRFPIHRVEDYAEKVPANWLKEGGFFIPLYQKEALFLQLEAPSWHPTIAKICVGRINAITGKPFSETLSRGHQDYVVIPNQKWLDGISSGEGLVRQFVAMPLGKGYTIESQITDEEKFGGFQFVVFECKPGRFPERDPEIDRRVRWAEQYGRQAALYCSIALDEGDDDQEMGIAAGGSIKQQIQKDTYGIESWSPELKRSLTIRLVNSLAYKEITGMEPPASPITAAEYKRAKIPWYSHYDETAPVIKPPSIFKRILGISAIEKKRGEGHRDQIQRSIAIKNIKKIRTPNKFEASSMFRQRAHVSRSEIRWESAIREISYVIDLQSDVRADDYALRSCCNFNLANWKDGDIDGSLALAKDKKCVEAVLWRAYCRMSIEDYDGASEDASRLLEFPETHFIGLHLKAETDLLKGNYEDAIKNASALESEQPEHPRASAIISEAKMKKFRHDF